MSQEDVLKTLSDLGLTRLDSKIYIYLAKKGPQKGKDISKALKVQKQQLYRSLKKLQRKAIVSATLEHPASFSAVSFEKILDLFIRAKLEEVQNIQYEKSKLLSSWEAIKIGATPDTAARFMVIEGRNIIYSRIKQMINETKSQLAIISTVTGLARTDLFGLLDSGFKHPQLSKVQFRLLTHLSKENVSIMQALLTETPKTKLRFEIRNPNLGRGLFPQMVIRDEEEVMFFINPKVDGFLPEQDYLCLWTNCKSLIHSFLTMFEELWRNSTDIEKKIIELKTGKAAAKTFLINDSEVMKKKYNEIIQCSQEEIIILTSSKGLIEQWKKMSQLKNLKERGVIVKIMAPIVKENWKAMEQLSKVFDVKHVPIQYWRTTIVDGKYLFQFKTPSSDREELGSTHLDNAFYSDDPDWMGTMRIALNDIWKSAQSPSTATLESIIGPHGPPVFPLPKDDLRTKIYFKVIDFKPPGTLNEKDLVNKIIHAKKIIPKDPHKDVSVGYGSYALGIIHPPDRFNLPDMMIQAWRHDKQSSFGEEDTIIVFLWLKTPQSYAYVPVAIAGDNPHGQNAWRAMFAATPAGKNIQLLKKDQIQVRIYGNTLFAGWTEPIPLFPAKYTLPPACILFEGYGDVRTTGFTVVQPSGFRVEMEDTTLDAFVTFIHPASKYSGPGTDGVLVRDHISTNIPP
jgi:sugar-specific transcriptional regulator TrmB